MREWAEMMLLELNESALFLDGHDEAVVGITSETEPRAVYDERLIIEGLMKDGCTWDEATDHYGFNILGSIPPDDPAYPLIIVTPDPEEG